MSAQPRIVPFDTLQYAKRLQSANVPPEQAEIQAEALQEILSTAIQGAELATRADIDRLDTKIDRLDTKIETQGKSVHAKIEAESNKVIIRIGGAVVAVLLALEVINRFWPKV